ncbi:MAG: GntR family transcriptional regulator [Tepidibacter sp.]|jgi:DNA-binding GntR family transcriptional regulator|uniref:GntR family transcriptional regulator n=1 Tax=Tepidibacter sp. TaxID=2529387 RepID=UPI0025FEECB3|nr:GntR family transcriptional regulator [Tepidibacter sp.]MCT4507213.1 GntR family transcriptional regulator [Tepidibacter sp.]
MKFENKKVNDMEKNKAIVLKKNKETLADSAYKKLETMIITLQLKPGSLWTEKELSELLEIGRMPVREAIQRLDAAHLLTIMPRRGVLVTEQKAEEFFLQLEVRRLLEKLIAIRAAKFATPSERDKFLQLADEYEKATNEKDELKAIEIDNEFNEFIGMCSRNHYATSAVAPLHALSRRLYYMQYNIDLELTKEINYAHCDLMRAVASGDEVLAGEKSDYLLDCVERLSKLNFDMYI